MRSLKRNDTDELTYKTETGSDLESLWFQSGRRMGQKIVREFGINIYTLLYLKWITKRSCCIIQGTLVNVMWQPEMGGGVLGENNTYIRMSESLHCPTETMTALLVGSCCLVISCVDSFATHGCSPPGSLSMGVPPAYKIERFFF